MRLNYKYLKFYKLSFHNVQYTNYYFQLNSYRISCMLYYSFPRDENVRKMWIQKVNRLVPGTKKVWKPSVYSKLCSAHFNDDDFIINFGRKDLKPGTVPSIFKHRPIAAKRKPPSRRSSEEASMNLDQSASSLSGSVNVDHNYAMLSPRKVNKNLYNMTVRLEKQKQLVRNIRRRELRLKGKVGDLLTKLQNQRLLSDHANELLSTFNHIPVNLFRCRKNVAYSGEQKKFATTLFYYSPAAYTYVKQYLPLPHKRTIQMWLSKYDASPGFTSQSFDTIREHNRSADAWAYKICALTLDEMEIKKQLQLDANGKVQGFIDLGSGNLNDDSLPQATKALAILAVGLYGCWKLPLGYWFTDGANGTFLASVITSSTEKLYEVGCVEVSVTADGAPCNVKAFETLGCKFHSTNLQSLFPHPSNASMKVCAILDVCHMMKLFRNMFHEYKVIKVPGVGDAKWRHIEQLQNIQENEGMTLANRLSRQHVQYQNQKMKVKLAVQVVFLQTYAITVLMF